MSSLTVWGPSAGDEKPARARDGRVEGERRAQQRRARTVTTGATGIGASGPAKLTGGGLPDVEESGT